MIPEPAGTSDGTRRFKVHARHIGGHHTRVLAEVSFEAAAVAYLEDFSLPAEAADEQAVNVVVADMETGHEHCFRVDLESGEMAPCG